MIKALLVTVTVLVSITGARAQDFVAFRSPSNNIHCIYSTGDGPASLRCDIVQISNTPPRRPPNCDLDWGKAFEVTATSTQGARICHGDTVVGDGTRIAYGQTWRRGEFFCTSAETGMTCGNSKGAGFELSRARQSVY